MTITINLPQATLDKLEAQAQASGKDVETFVKEAVEAKLARSGRTLREILEPIHKKVAESGVSEQELDDLFEQELAAVRAQRQESQKQS